MKWEVSRSILYRSKLLLVDLVFWTVTLNWWDVYQNDWLITEHFFFSFCRRWWGKRTNFWTRAAMRFGWGPPPRGNNRPTSPKTPNRRRSRELVKWSGGKETWSLKLTWGCSTIPYGTSPLFDWLLCHWLGRFWLALESWRIIEFYSSRMRIRPVNY